MSLSYYSTRGSSDPLDLKGVTLNGLALDGGLYLPQSWPEWNPVLLTTLKEASYQEIAFRVMQPFMQGVVDDVNLRHLIHRAYAGFSDPAITPIKKLDDGLYVQELFHGPTLAFKDVALQFLGHVFEYFVRQDNRTMTVVGATSGDTGSAAMAALAGRQGIQVTILYPAKGPSDVQRRQMTTIPDTNVQAIAIDGTFDDCQAIVKALFHDTAFRTRHRLAAVNSINWLRILAQMVYYVVASVRLGADRPISFVVPTGNFGNVFAAYAAMQCGVLVSKLGVASNRNDILTRFFTSGLMEAKGVVQSLSPSMDIDISSNFERLLFDMVEKDPTKLVGYMHDLKTKGQFRVSPKEFGFARQVFTATRLDDAETLETIRSFYERTGYVLDPHSAVAVGGAQKMSRELPTPVVAMACAHPAKFPETIQRAIGKTPDIPPALHGLMEKPERLMQLPASVQEVAKVIEQRA